MADSHITELGASPNDPYERAAQTFPRLSDDMANRVANYGAAEHFEAGDLRDIEQHAVSVKTGRTQAEIAADLPAKKALKRAAPRKKKVAA